MSMVVTQLSEEKLRQLEADLAPDVVRIRARVGEDWSEHPAAFFKVILSDAASQPAQLKDVALAVEDRLDEEFGFDWSELIPYVRFRSESEQANLKEEAWD